MKIIFVGQEIHAHFVKEVTVAHGWELVLLPESVQGAAHIDEQINEISVAGSAGGDFIIYDVRKYVDDVEVIVDRIQMLYNANHLRPIIFADTADPRSTIVRACVAAGFKNVIAAGAGTAAELKNQLIRTVTGYYEANGGTEEVKRIEEAMETEKQKAAAFRTIAVAGAMHRIGTSTQAMQLARYLTALHYKACIIELNENKYENRRLRRGAAEQLSYFEKTRLTLATDIDDEEKGYVRVNGLDMYYKPEYLPNLLDMDYDFFVYDYGVYTAGSFNKTAFLKDDIQIFCVGGGTAEIDYAVEIGSNASYQKASLLFSFTAPGDEEEVRAIFNDFGAGQRCFFAKYTPDPFTLSDFPLYNALLGGLEEKPQDPEEAPKKKRKGLFGRREA